MVERERVDSAHITPSAHYTGYVWFRHRLAEPAFATVFGRWVHGFVAPINWGAQLGFGLNIEDFLLQRHLMIDARLTQADEREGVVQVVEMACGLSPRGRRFRQRYPQLRYLEADLPPMAARKAALLREHPRYRQIRWGVGIIGRLTRGSYPLHYRNAAEIEAAFARCGFASPLVLDPQREGAALGLPQGRLPSLVRVIESRTA